MQDIVRVMRESSCGTYLGALIVSLVPVTTCTVSGSVKQREQESSRPWLHA